MSPRTIEIDGGNTVALVAAGTCDKCKRVKRVIEFDTSEEEHRSLSLCKKCILSVFSAEAEPPSMPFDL